MSLWIMGISVWCLFGFLQVGVWNAYFKNAYPSLYVKKDAVMVIFTGLLGPIALLSSILSGACIYKPDWDLSILWKSDSLT